MDQFPELLAKDVDKIKDPAVRSLAKLTLTASKENLQEGLSSQQAKDAVTSQIKNKLLALVKEYPQGNQAPDA
jgi:hypothetical protein